jgi:hypothetical protein
MLLNLSDEGGVVLDDGAVVVLERWGVLRVSDLLYLFLHFG